MFSFLGSTNNNVPQEQPTEVSETVDTSMQQADVAVQAPVSPITAPPVEQSAERFTGQVKFFNDQNMYGFIRRLDTNEDVFVHIRDLEPKQCPAPTLFTGEYVTFSVSPNGLDADGNPRYKAVHVQGIDGGSLMCDHGEITFRSYSRYGFGQ